MEKFVLSLFIENSTKYSKIHIIWKCNKNNKSNLWYSTPKFIIPFQSTYISTFILKMCIYECPQVSKTFSFGQSPCDHQISTRKQNSIKIQNSKPS
jgi:hypothetical protein